MITIELSNEEAFALYAPLKRIVPIILQERISNFIKEFTDNLQNLIGIKYELSKEGFCITRCPHNKIHKDDPKALIFVNSLLCTTCKDFIENDAEKQILICKLSLGE